MSLGPGVRLGVYEIVALVGSGGMGEVYRARDSRLGRDVAIKVLSSGVAADEERLRRFEQEARAAAALNHPNILAVYDIGTNAGAPYVVSELLEGGTLRDRLADGALPIRKAIAIAVQIARGLAAAHGKGLVHRDLKPENVFVLDDGHVKLLDFGLAKLMEREPALSGLSAIATTPPDTLPGVVLGTIGYMSPEQVRGLPADHRSDLFSFGTILYELLSGQRAFRGETSADTMTAILKEDPPDLSTADRRLPAALARIVGRCLEKAPAARFQSAEDLAFALEALSVGDSGAAEAVAGSVATPRSREKRAWVLVALLSVALVAALAWAAVAQLGRGTVETRAIRFTISPPDGWSLPVTLSVVETSARGPLSVSPDGRRIAFIGRSVDDKDVLWVRTLDTLAAQMLPGTEGVSLPFWSPDSRFIGFFAGGKLRKIDLSGGPPIALCDVVGGAGGTWNGDGVILFADFPGPSRSGPMGLQRVPAAGGLPVVVTTAVPDDSNHGRPVFLPDGRHFLYSVVRSGAAKPVYLASLDSPNRTKILDADSSNVLYSQGHLLFLRGTTLMAQPFDLRRLTLGGEAFPVAESIQTQIVGNVVSGVFSASDAGVLVYETGSALTNGTQLTWFDRAGKTLGLLGDRGSYADVALAPDGRHASVTVADGQSSSSARGGLVGSDVWIFDVTRAIRTRLTFDQAPDQEAIWSPDGHQIIFRSGRQGAGDLFERSADGSGSDLLLLADGTTKRPLSWSPDGRSVLYSAASRVGNLSGDTQTGAGPDLWMLPLHGDRKPALFLRTPFLIPSVARFSPDGRWIAYVSAESGQAEVYATSFPQPTGKIRISAAGGSQPRWRGDGKEIFYVSPDNKLVAAEVSMTGATLEVGGTQSLFTLVPGGQRSAYDVTGDGQRFLVNHRADQTPSTPLTLTVVVNWAAALGRTP